MPILFRLVKLGYGTLEEVRALTAHEVMQALHYEDFLSDYESAELELNRDNS